MTRCLQLGWFFSLGLAQASFGAIAGENSAPPPLPGLLADHPTDDVLAERFAHPPSGAGILKIIHPWPDQTVAQSNLIDHLRQQGFGGVVCNVAFEDYLVSQTKWEAFQQAVRAARQAGFTLWLYDERGYPSGNAGGQVLKSNPEWQARGLLVSDMRTKGGSVTLSVPPGIVRLAAAFPLDNNTIRLSNRQDLSGTISNGQLRWLAPAGSWEVMVITENPLFEGTHAALNLADKMPYINLLQPEPTARFLQLTHQHYASRLGDNLGRWFVSTFTDEPSLMSLFLRPMPYRVLPWSENLKTAWEKRSGRVYSDLLPALVAEAGSTGMAARYGFWRTVGDLVSENFFGQIQSWCAHHQVLSGGHLLMEEETAGHTGLYGNAFECLRRLDAPSMDCLTSVPSEVPWRIARWVASAAELTGKQVVMCEASDHVQVYRAANDQRPKRIVTEPEIRGSLNRLAAGGVNVFTSYYSFGGLDDEALRRLNAYVSRVCSFLVGGHSAAEIAVVYPAESLWVHHIPARSGATDGAQAGEINHIYRVISETLFSANREFTYVDSRALSEAVVRPGCLAHGDLRWRVVVLPSVDTLPESAWSNLDRFVEDGGILLACGLPPANSEQAFPAKAVTAFCEKRLGHVVAGPSVVRSKRGGLGIYLPADLASTVGSVLGEILEPTMGTTPQRSPIRCAHRHIAGSEVFFVFNDSSARWAGQITLRTEGAGELWDPLAGDRKTLESGETIQLEIEPYGSRLARFAKARPPRRVDTVEPRLWQAATRHSLPKVQPRNLCGEFVQPELTTIPSTNSADSRWRLRGTVMKSDVDVFQFAGFTYETTVDLSKEEAIMFEVTVPEGQACSAKVLVILREDKGGDFLAVSSRSLAAGGTARVMLPLDQFQLAGWSTDADGSLDLHQIREIRIGWGGYLGQEGETVQFELSEPQAMSRSDQQEDQRKREAFQPAGEGSLRGA